MSGLTIEEAQEHIEVLKSKMEEEINYYKTEIQLALQDADHDKKWEDYQKYLNEWEQNAEETENERQIKISQSYRADSNYDFWENYDEREDYNSKSEEEEASENSCEEDDAEEDDADEDDANSDEEEADSDEEDADSDEDESKERDDNVVTYQLLQSMFDYKNAEPEDCCFCKSEEEEEEESRLDQLQKKIDGIDNVVYQLLGGMFNHETQSNILDFHLRTLSWKKNTNTDTDSNDEEFLNESAWPTTRQGDQNEEDIRLLKQQVLKLEETNNYLIRIIKEQLGINL